MTEINSSPIKSATTLVAACRRFFDLKTGQGLREFAAEIKELTPKDRDDLVLMFHEIGIDASKVA